jgi:tagatose 1,6-diphosphate aldolase GatY/KbaY
MSYINTKNMLLAAHKGSYAVGAFNAENMETVQAIVAAAEELKAPVIIQTTPGSVKYAGLDYFVAMVKAAAKNAKVDIALHIDHGEDADSCIKGIEAGYSSVMIDGSKLPLEQNIFLTKTVLAAAKRKTVSVEAELGTLAGKEDSLVGTASYTSPDEAVSFIKETGADSLAIAVGTAHGIYKTVPILNTELISTIHALIPNTPLVLHGASGLSEQSVRDCVKRGMSKVNFATELRQAFSGAIGEYFALGPKVIDPKKYLTKARDAVKEAVKARIRILGCAGKG